MAIPTDIKDKFCGTFIASPKALLEKLAGVKAFIFDWDGVFNNGFKDEHGSSPFSEVDSMGVNMLRFNHYLRNGKTPYCAIISGERNKASFTFSVREHFDAAYYKIMSKKDALHHVCDTNGLKPSEIAFFFDDVLDMSFAAQCGLRIMVNRESNPMLLAYAKEHNIADYITAADGGAHAVREAAELLIGLTGMYNETIQHRSDFTEKYKAYLAQRNMPEPVFYTTVREHIKEQLPQ